jgi:hypothetical protein
MKIDTGKKNQTTYEFTVKTTELNEFLKLLKSTYANKTVKVIVSK